MKRTVMNGLLIAILVGGPCASVLAQSTAPIYGQQLMSEQERNEYRQTMRNLRTQEEREQFRLEHHRQMQERARQMGVELPDAPPAQRGGKGMQRGSGGQRGGGRRGN